MCVGVWLSNGHAHDANHRGGDRMGKKNSKLGFIRALDSGFYLTALHVPYAEKKSKLSEAYFDSLTAPTPA